MTLAVAARGEGAKPGQAQEDAVQVQLLRVGQVGRAVGRESGEDVCLVGGDRSVLRRAEELTES